MTVASVPAAGQSLPTGGQVAAGSVTIGQPVGGAMTVRQTSDRGVVNWQTFNVGAGGRVDFQQPSASSATLNRVTGSTSSVIAGQISANGQVFLVNPNGIQITPSGAVRTGAFVASTLDIKNSDFLSGRTVFEGNGRSAGVVNQGTIETAPGGSVVLMGGRVVNEGTITAEGGRVGLASGERVVVDLQGDGFLQVSVPTADAERTEALIKHTGRIQANGGRVAMRAATTADVARAAITVSGAIEARTVMRTEAGVVFGTDAGAPAPTGPVTVQRGKIEIDGGPGGSVTTSGRISAGSGTQRGGDIRISGNGVTTAGTLDVSGGTVGGTIAVDGGARLDASGAFLASGGTTGGRIDLTADDARVTQASLLATGGSVGGLIRIGGAFQGGKTKDNAPELEATFLARWADVSTLRSATTTRIDSNTSIDVSGGTAGGTAIVWSNDMTWMAGAVKATGALSAGSVEVSGAQTLAFIDLGRLQIGNGGQLLLDPKNITIATSGSAAVAANDQFGDNNSSSVTISPNSLTTLLDAGTAVTLQASTNITVSNAISVNNAAGSGGNLTLQAGRSIIINANITTDNGNLTLIANETVANGVINARRDSGAASLTFAGTTITAGTGTVTILMNTGAGLTNATSGNISLGTIASAGAVNVTYSGPTAAGLIQLNGNITASGNITLSNRSLRVGANSTLTSTGGTVTWAGEGSQTIAGVAGGEQIKVVEGSAITRIGLMDTADAARLAIGQTAPSRAYGDANPAVDTLRLVSGTLRAGDTLGGILAAGSTATTWSGGAAPAAAANVGSYGYTVTASGAIAINATERGYFITTTTSGSLSVTARPITVKADALTKIYGDADPALTWQITNGNLVGTDTLSGSLARAVGETVTGGPYAITQGTLANGNYAISFTGATFTITPASLNVAATARTKVYGDADPALTFTASGFKFSDTAASVLTGSVSRTAGETVAAGPYAITQGSLAANTNYSIIYTGANLTITPASLNVAANARTKVYGDADPALTFTATGLRFSDTAAGVLTGTLSRDAGETASGSPYAITRGSLAANANYTIVYTGANLTITPAPLNVTANARTKVYGDVDPALTFTATGFKFSDTTASVLTGGLSRSAGESVAGGPYAITQGSLAANANYSIVSTGANFAIIPAPLNVTANARTKVYGDVDPALTFTATGFKFSDTAASVLTGGLSRSAGESVAGGPYAITQGSLAANANYSIVYTGANLTITPALLNVTANSQTKVYGDSDPGLTFSAGGFRLSDMAASVLTGGLGRVAGETVASGPYAITQGSLAANSNYSIIYTGANLTVTPAPLSVAANARTKVYGDADPALTFTATGFKFSDTAASVLTGGLSRSAGETVAAGPYAIAQGSLAANANYSIVYTGANLTVTPAPLNVAANSRTKVYGDADPALDFVATGFKFSDAAGSVLSGSLSRASGETVAGGPYAINQGSLVASANYTIIYTGANLAITPAPLTVAANNRTKVYGDADPTLTFTAAGFRFSDTVASVLGGSLSRSAGETVAGGPYAITQGTLTANTNYAISYTGATLGITPAPLTVTANAQTKIYGDADPALTFAASGFKFSDSAAGILSGGLSRTAGETVAGGPYAITQGSLAANSNYTISYTGANLAITPARLSVAANSQTKVYGDTDPVLTYTASGFRFSDTAASVLTGGLSRTAGETVAGGPYAITQGSLAANANYSIVYTAAALGITPAPLNVVATTQTKIYGDADPALTFTASGFRFSDTAATVLTGGLSRVAGETVAGYAITQGSLAANANYSVVYTGAVLTVTPAPLTVVANAQTKVYGDADPALAFTASGFKFSDTATSVLTGGLSRTPGETVAGGPYAITQGTLAANSNYTISYTGANLAITPAPLTVVANRQTKIYGDTDPALTFTASGFRFSDTAGVLTGSLVRAAGENVAGGPYAIAQGTLTATANYSIIFTGANLSITPAPLNVVANSQTKIYGDADPALTFAASGFRFSDTAAGMLIGSLGRTAGETVAGGPYAITQGTLSANTNYSVVYTGANLGIAPAPLTVVANGQTKVYGDADPVLTFTANGFRFSDTAAGVLTGGLSRAAGETVAGGPYAITQGTLAANANYSIVYTSANLGITPAPLTVGANGQTKIYGDADPALTFIANGFKFSDTLGTVLTGGLSRTAGETVAGGPYAITQGSLASNANYSIVYTGANLGITPAPLTVVADARTKVYGDADPALTFAATGFRFSDTAASVLAGSLSRAPGESVAGGPYAITQGSLTANANYAMVYTGAALTITPAPLTVIAAAQAKVYGDADPALTFSASGFKFGDGPGTVLSGGLSRSVGESVAGGPYAITLGTLAAGANYTIVYAGAHLAVTPRPITIAADDQAKTAQSPDPAFTWSLRTGRIVVGDTPTGGLSRAVGEAAGTYAITQGSFTYGPNYSLTFVDGAFTIAPQPTQPPRGIATAGMTTPGVPSVTVTAHPLQPAPLDIFATDAQDGGCAVNGQGTLICP